MLNKNHGHWQNLESFHSAKALPRGLAKPRQCTPKMTLSHPACAVNSSPQYLLSALILILRKKIKFLKFLNI